MRKNRRTPVVTFVACLLVSACGTDNATSEAETSARAAAKVAMNPELHSLLPDIIRDAGVISVGGPVTEAPRLYLEQDGVTLTGYMYDLANAVGDQLGVDIEYREMPFASLIPGLQRGIIDMTLTISDKKSQHEVLDFVDYLRDGLKILVPAGNPMGFDSLASLCGHTVAVLRGSVAVGVASEASQSCSEPIEIKEYPRATLAQLAVRSRQADATFGGSTALSHVSKTFGEGTIFTVAPGGPYTVQPDAFAFLKGNDQLRDAVRQAMQQLVDNGTAAEILEKHGVDSDSLYLTIPINVVE